MVPGKRLFEYFILMNGYTVGLTSQHINKHENSFRFKPSSMLLVDMVANKEWEKSARERGGVRGRILANYIVVSSHMMNKSITLRKTPC